MLMRVIARVENFPCANSFAAMSRNGKLPVGEVSEVRHDMALVLKGLRNGSLEPADMATAEKAGGEVLGKFIAAKALAKPKAEKAGDK